VIAGRCFWQSATNVGVDIGRSHAQLRIDFGNALPTTHPRQLRERDVQGEFNS
jgi:hypothetical protein